MLDRGGEVELGEASLDLGPRRVEPREDPALLEVARPRSGCASPTFASISRDTFQSLFASLRPSSIIPAEKRTSWVERHLQQPVAGRVGAVLVDQLGRVDAGAEALRHPAAVRGEDHRVVVDVVERDGSPMSSIPAQIIRETQRKLMSRPVEQTSPG